MPGVRETGSARGCPRLQRAARIGSARPVRAVGTQHVGEDGDRVVALEGDEGGRLGKPIAEGRLDACTEWAQALGQVAQERDRSAVVAQQRRPFGELRLPGRAPIMISSRTTSSSGLPTIPPASLTSPTASSSPASKCRPASTQPGRVSGTRAPLSRTPSPRRRLDAGIGIALELSLPHLLVGSGRDHSEDGARSGRDSFAFAGGGISRRLRACAAGSSADGARSVRAARVPALGFRRSRRQALAVAFSRRG